jgi:hypothetical protein
MKFKFLPFEIIENICDFLIAKDIEKCNHIFSKDSIKKVVKIRIQFLSNHINSYIKEYKMDKKLLNYTHNHDTTSLHNLEHTHIYCLIYISQLYNYPVIKMSNTEYVIDTTYKRRKVHEIVVISSSWLSNALIHYDAKFAEKENKSKSNTIKIRRGSNSFKPDININTDLCCRHYYISPKVCKFIPVLLWNQLKAYYPLSQTILYDEFLIRSSTCFECKLHRINITKKITEKIKTSLYYGKASQNLMIDYYD